MEAKYSIGTKFQSRGKHPRTCTIIDIHKTFNNAGELVKIRYVATHEFCGQLVKDSDVNEATIGMGGVI